MDTDWINRLAGILPTIGGLVGSIVPGVGTVAGAGVGTAIRAVAEFLGVEPTIEAIQPAIDAAGPDKLIEMQTALAALEAQLELEHLRAETARLREVNLTMRVESRSEHWPQWGWRPFWGFISGAAVLFEIVVVCLAVWQGRLAAVAQVVAALTPVWGVPLAVLGISAWGRNRLKEMQQQPTMQSLRKDRE